MAATDDLSAAAHARRQFEDFLYREAILMDGHKYDEWLSMWATEALYWIPSNDEDNDPARHVSIVYEDRAKIETRVRRLKGSHAHAQRPRSRVVRVISNILLEHTEDSQLVGTSSFVLGEVRLDRQTVWFGRSRHVLIQQADGLKIREKKVFILNNDSPMGNLTFLV